MELQKTEIGVLAPEQLKTLEQASIIPSRTPASQVSVFAQVCKEKGISPFSKHIYLLRYGNKYQAIMGIDGFRFIAERTGLHAGTDEVTFDNGMTLDECIGKSKSQPRSASCTVYKIVAGVRVAYTHSVKWSEFAGSGNWKKMPFQMLAKVAEAFALKKAFPGALSGVHVEEEKAAFMESAGVEVEEVMSEEESKAAYDNLIADINEYKDGDVLMQEFNDILPDGLTSYYKEEAQKYARDFYNKLKAASDEK